MLKCKNDSAGNIELSSGGVRLKRPGNHRRYRFDGRRNELYSEISKDTTSVTWHE
jgi:hypothetical protein